jgi:cytochrome c-type biogenesis protein CcmH/NrfG
MNWVVMLAVTVMVWLALVGVLRPVAGHLASPELAARLRRLPPIVLMLALAAVGVRAGSDRPSAAPERPPATPSAAVLDPVEQRVREHPGDAGARLALARHYLSTGAPGRAVDEYVAVLRLDNRNAEAYASLGYLLYLAGRPQDGLWAEDQALRLAPARAEAHYYRGVILLTGLDCVDQGRASLRGYLDRAPDGTYRADAERLLAAPPPGGTASGCTVTRRSATPRPPGS